MNFRQIATEIMLTANEEKWYETRERIERALEKAACRCEDHSKCDPRFDCYCGTRNAWAGYVPPPHFSIDHWRDQPDGVR